jgi:endogenous inhibitor of DNA gyrase (YacG/DUF329 family)
VSTLRVKCPTCGRETEWAESEYRPFCSDRCRLIDLGAWFTENRGIAGENAAPDTIDAGDGRPRDES